MKQNRFPAGWNESRVQRVLEHYEGQTEEEEVAEDEAAFALRGHIVTVVPKRLVPEITRFIERRPSGHLTSSRPARKARRYH